jgi:hypothetical protein
MNEYRTTLYSATITYRLYHVCTKAVVGLTDGAATLLLIWVEKANRLRAAPLLAPPIVAAPTRSLPMAITGCTMRDAIAELVFISL